uniref:FHA domain-containing protein n=1 Tax=Taenia asiatica TaxID=60517 RepID=A0A0R3W7A6_TAEAS
LLTNRDYTVGRADADFVMLDPSVSRLHAKIRISYPEEAVDVGSRMMPALEITDVSRFGTFLNGSRIARNVVTSVPSDSNITFGAMPGVTVAAKMYPLNVLLSSISPSAKKKARSAVHSLGGKISCEWTEECNLLVMSKLVVTHKALCCLLHSLDIVTPEYLCALENSCHCENFCDPDRSRHLPPIEEKGFSDLDAPKFYANPKRRLVFDGKTFVFLTASKFQRFCLLLSLTNAKSVCIAETLSSNRRHFMDIFASMSDPCVLYETKNTTPEHDLAYSVLKEGFNRRPILEQEVALAIIESSCETYCNATRPCSISNTRRFLSFPIGYKSWDVEMPSAAVSKCASNLKRRLWHLLLDFCGFPVYLPVLQICAYYSRENIGSDNEAIAIKESKLKRRSGQAPLLLTSTLFDNFDKNLSFDLVLASTLGDPDTSLDLTAHETENLAPDICSPPRSSPSNGFLSKEKNKKVCRVHFDIVQSVDYQILDNPSSTTPTSADGNDVNVKTKVCALVNSAVLPRRLSRPETEPQTVDFKRFAKVWPTCYNEAVSGKRRNTPKSKSPIKITLVPFVPNSKVSAELLHWHPEDGPSQTLNEDAALINKLFE